VTKHQRDDGQAAIELALCLPLLCLLVLAVVQLTVVLRDELAVQLAAREAARAAAASAQPQRAGTAAALNAVGLRPIVVQVAEGGRTVTATVRYVQHTDVAVIGALLPDVVIEESVSMAIEPP